MAMKNSMSNKINVVLADDHPLFREGVARTLMADPELDIVGEATNAEEAVKLAADLLPDIIMLDISMPGSGLAAAKQIASVCPVVKIIMLTASEHDDDVTSALQAGARGYILKGIGGEELIDIVKVVHQGESYVPPDLAARLLTGAGERVVPGPLAELTAREEQILKGVARGLSNKEIGRELDLQEKTVKHYMTNILQKLRVRNRVEAALVAKEHLPSTD